ncbi:MAG: oligosaccharide flippase family protein [Ginsengibacter sp.]
MDLFSKFKKDYFNYLVSIILPAFISGVSIPLFKHLLGAKGYGNFSIWFNAMLIVTSILSGWIAQSILLFYPGSADKQVFSKTALILSGRTQAIFFIPAFLIVWAVSHDVILASLCALVLFVVSIQFTILPVIQSSFLSKKVILSELIRIVSYVGVAIALLQVPGLSYLYSLFFAVIVSYSLSLLYLIRQARIFFRIAKKDSPGIEITKGFFRKFFNYGAPLSLWFVFSYLLSYVDKIFILHKFGGEVQGNYQAIFDLLSKGIILLISPIVTSLFPILTTAYSSGNIKEIRRLLKRIIMFEFGGFVVASAAYWLFGAAFVLRILKTPDTFSFRLMGFLVIAGTFIWQIAILVQKRFELKLRSLYLLAMVFIAFVVQIVFYITFRNYDNQLLYPMGFLLSAFIYLCLVSFSELVAISKSLKIKQVKL